MSTSNEGRDGNSARAVRKLLAGAMLFVAPLLAAGSASSLLATPAYAKSDLPRFTCMLTDNPDEKDLGCARNWLVMRRVKMCFTDGGTVMIDQKTGMAICSDGDGSHKPGSFPKTLANEEVRAFITFINKGEGVFMEAGRFEC